MPVALSTQVISTGNTVTWGDLGADKKCEIAFLNLRRSFTMDVTKGKDAPFLDVLFDFVTAWLA